MIPIPDAAKRFAKAAVGATLGLLLLFWLFSGNSQSSALPVPEYLSYDFRDLNVSVPSTMWDAISHDDFAVYLRQGNYTAKVDASYQARDRVGSVIRRWNVNSYVWSEFEANTSTAAYDFNRWTIYERRKVHSSVFVAYHPFGVIVWGDAADRAMLMNWIRSITLTQRG
jgi:hypothetical protein